MWQTDRQTDGWTDILRWLSLHYDYEKGKGLELQNGFWIIASIMLIRPKGPSEHSGTYFSQKSVVLLLHSPQTCCCSTFSKFAKVFINNKSGVVLVEQKLQHKNVHNWYWFWRLLIYSMRVCGSAWLVSWEEWNGWTGLQWRKTRCLQHCEWQLHQKFLALVHS